MSVLMQILMGATGIFAFLTLALASLVKYLYRRNKELNRRLIAVKAELNGFLMRAKTRNEVDNLSLEDIDKQLDEFYRKED